MSSETTTSFDELTRNLPNLCRAIIERSPLPMAVVVGQKHIVAYVNAAYCYLVGKKKEDLIGHHFAETGTEIDNFMAILDRVYRTGKAETRAEQESSDPHIHHLSYDVWAIPDADQRPVGIVVQLTASTPLSIHRQQLAAMNQELMISAVRQHEMIEEKESLNSALQAEITERKQAEQALRNSEDALRQANEGLEQKVRERTTDLQQLAERLERSRNDLRKLASELVRAEERERKRIAAVLHDDIAQTLATIKMHLDLLLMTSKGKLSGKDIAETQMLLADTIRETRSLMNDVGNPLLFEMGLAAACESLAERLMTRHPVSISCDIRESFKTLDSDLKVVLYQVFRELLNNVVKHSGAKTARVMIDRKDGQIFVKVIDDGSGFNTQVLGAPTPEGGYGLYSIRERLSAFSGSLQIESTPQKGTLATVALPIKED